MIYINLSNKILYKRIDLIKKNKIFKKNCKILIF